MQPDDNTRSGKRKVDLTRREWLIRLGGTAAALDLYSEVRGLPATKALVTPPTAEVATRDLPPGLYLPSNEHLKSAMMADGQFHHAILGSETVYSKPPVSPFEPQFFTPSEFKIVKRLVDLVLGATDSKASPVEWDDATNEEISQWIDLEVHESSKVEEAARKLSPQHRALTIQRRGAKAMEELDHADRQKIWREGLEWLEMESNHRYHAPFLDLENANQVELMRLISDDREVTSTENAGTRLFVVLKNLAFYAYYTSRRGLTELNYRGNTFYGESPGCSGHGSH